ncbi:MAG TPA: ribonuclease P protein component [Candidatus Acidoferrum sp.]|nr:ribonuclease P protein component [Candidatus Acidoferrum sp.]
MPLASIFETSSRWSQYEGMMADAAQGNRLEIAMPPKKAARFPRTARLLRHADFERVYKQGRRHFSASMTFFYWPRSEATQDTPAKNRRAAPQGLRVGFTVGRALGGAVQRNRMKRRLREAVRLSHPPIGIAADVVINPKKSLLSADFSDALKEVSRAFGVIEHKLSRNAVSMAAMNKIPESREPEAGSRS